MPVHRGSRTPFQRWLAEQMAKHDWSYRDLAARLTRGRQKCSPSTVMYYLRGPNLPTPSRQEVLAEVTGTSLEEVHRLVWESARLHEQWNREHAEYVAELREEYRRRRRPGSADAAVRPTDLGNRTRRLAEASRKVREESMRVNAEFEPFERAPDA